MESLKSDEDIELPLREKIIIATVMTLLVLLVLAAAVSFVAPI